jgi:putative transposase
MVQYRRNRLEGGTYFFTVTLLDRRSKWLTERVDDLRQAYLKAQQRKPFQTVAIVILPDHLHTIWTLPEGDANYSGRWRLIKSEFSHVVARSGHIRRRSGSDEFHLWQRRFWEHTIRDENDLKRHVD